MPEPFLKWPGGKRWLVQKYAHLFPSRFKRYIEPFVGSGAVFFHLGPESAVLSDKNRDLLCAYRAIKAHPDEVDRALLALQQKHGKSFYYHMRKAQPEDSISRAVRFLYLNRTCFNGIYRVNRNGEFNVPMGTKTQVAYEQGYLATVSSALKCARIVVADFEEAISRAGVDDFVYADPPYTVMHNSNNFVKYNDVLFSWDDQRRLAEAVRQAARRGAMVLVSNADHASVRELYRGLGQQHTVCRASRLAASAAARRATTELVVTNYL